MMEQVAGTSAENVFTKHREQARLQCCEAVYEVWLVKR